MTEKHIREKTPVERQKQPIFFSKKSVRSIELVKMKNREYVGNNKRITIANNKNPLRIIGNDNKIVIKINSGSVNVIGNSTTVKIGENSGKVSYIGNHGKLYFGPNSNLDAVQYIGNDGTMKIINMDIL